MENITVTLDLNRYEELIKIEKGVEEGKTLKVSCHFDYYRPAYRGTSYYTFYSESEALENLADINKELLQENRKYLNKLFLLESELEKLRHSSYWEFKKWKKDFNIDNLK